MKRIVLLLLAAAIGLQAETFEDSTLRLKLDGPKDFTKSPTTIPDNEFLGAIKVMFMAPDIAESHATLLVHHMTIPSTLGDYKSFKESISTSLAGYFGENYKEIKKDDLKVGEKEGYLIEYNCMGGDSGPSPDGTVPLRVRWYVVRDGEDKLFGFIFIAKREKWETLEPEFAKSFKTLKLEK